MKCYCFHGVEIHEAGTGLSTVNKEDLAGNKALCISDLVVSKEENLL